MRQLSELEFEKFKISLKSIVSIIYSENARLRTNFPFKSPCIEIGGVKYNLYSLNKELRIPLDTNLEIFAYQTPETNSKLNIWMLRISGGKIGYLLNETIEKLFEPDSQPRYNQ